MAIYRYLKSVTNFIRHDLSLEPVIFGYLFTWFVIEGSQMTTNILITKICHIEMQYPKDFCKNITTKSNMSFLPEEFNYTDPKTAEAAVQRRVNDFEVILVL